MSENEPQSKKEIEMCRPQNPREESGLQYSMLLSKMRTFLKFIKCSGMKAQNNNLCFHRIMEQETKLEWIVEWVRGAEGRQQV